MSLHDPTIEEAGPVGLDCGIEALRASPEFTGTVEHLDGAHTCNDHLALLYETREEQLAASVPFVRQGIERGEKVLYVTGDLDRDRLGAALEAGGVDVEAAIASGALEFFSPEETYLRNESFEPEEMIDFYDAAIQEATVEFSALRVAAETTWLQDSAITLADFLEYESKVNDLFEDEPCIALCQYDRNGFSPEVVRDLVRTHPHLIYEGTVCHNFFYTPPEEFFGPDEPARDVDRMMGTLLERTEAKTALHERQQVLQRLYESIARPDTSFREKLQRVLDLGCEWFDLDLGALNRVDVDDDRLVVEHVNADHGLFEPGAEFRLSETYCQAATDIEAAASVSDPEGRGFDDITVYEDFGVQGYLGTYVPVEGGVDRTLAFVPDGPAPDSHTADDHTLLDLMGQWVKYELERHRREQDLRKLYEITADREAPLDDQVHRLLSFGCERFGLDQGYLVDVHCDGTVEIEQAVEAGDADVRTGIPDAQPEADQFCRRTVRVDESVGVADVRDVGWHDDPVAEESGLQSYFGVTVTEGDEPYGTLAFCDTSPRDRPFSDAERTFLELMGQWVSQALGRRRRQRQFAALNEVARDLTDAETRTEVAERTVSHARLSLDLPVAAVVDYDADRGSLSPLAQTPRAEDALPLASLCARDGGPLWDVFVSGDTRRLASLDAMERTGSGLTEVLAVPLGRDGLFVAATPVPDGFSDADVDFLAATAATVEAAATRADREQQLRRREETLEAKNATLERLNRVNDIIRNIDQALVGASTRSEVETVVCEQLARVGPYELAWIGEPAGADGSLTPKECAGVERDFLDELGASDGGETHCRGPVGRAVDTGDPQVVNDVLEDGSAAGWRQAALDRGFHACIALPLSYGGSVYGVLVVYAGRPGVFEDLERSVLTELADTIAYAVNAAESKKALVSDEVTHLQFSLGGSDLPVGDVAREFDCEIRLESVVPGSDGQFRAFFSTRGAPPDALRDAGQALRIEDLSLVAAHEERDENFGLFEVSLPEQCLFTTIVEHGGRPHEFTVDADGARLTVELAADAAVREFVTMFESAVQGAELVAQRTCERPQQTPAEFFAGLTETLTDRQLETLQIAYYGGYLDEPRLRAATDLANVMGIAQPTFNSHLRAAQRKLCEQLFEERAPSA